MKSGIYIIENSTNKKVYVGSSTDIRRRVNIHLCRLRKGNHDNRHLQFAWNRDGEHSFVLRQILDCAKDNLLFYEQRAIDAYLSFNRSHGYNLRRFAEANYGIVPTPEHRAAINAGIRRYHEARQKANPRPKKHIPISAQAAKTLAARNTALFADPEHGPKRRAAISAALKGKAKTEEHRLAIQKGSRTRLKLTDAQVIAGKNDTRPVPEIARELNMSPNTIRSIQRGEKWDWIV